MLHKKLRIVYMLCGVLSFYAAWAQEDINIDDIEDLFGDTSQDDLGTQDQTDEDASEFDVFQERESDSLEIRGKNSFIYPFLYSAFVEESEYFNYDEYPRTPQQKNTLGFEYNAPSISVVTEINVDFYGTSVNNIQEIIQASFGETYISAHAPYFDVTAGLQNYSWGTAVGFNPTDNLNPLDYRGGFTHEKVPLLSVAMKLYPISTMSFELVMAPVYQPFKTPFVRDELSILKEEMSQLVNSSPAPPEAKTELKTLWNNTPKEAFVSAQPEDPLSQIQVGGKLNLFLSFADISFSYLYDVDDFYSFNNENIIPTTSLIKYKVDFLRRRIHRFGFDIIGSIQSVGLWAELATDIAEDIDASSYGQIRNHNISWVVGTDFSFGNKNTLQVVLQQLGDYIFDYPTSALDATNKEDVSERMNYALAEQTEGLRLGGMTDVSLSLLSDKIIPSIRAVYFYPLMYDDSDTKRFGSLIMMPSLEVVPLDSFSIIIGTELSYAWEDDYHVDEKTSRNNRVFVEIAYEWSWGK